MSRLSVSVLNRFDWLRNVNCVAKAACQVASPSQISTHTHSRDTKVAIALSQIITRFRGVGERVACRLSKRPFWPSGSSTRSGISGGRRRIYPKPASAFLSRRCTPRVFSSTIIDTKHTHTNKRAHASDHAHLSAVLNADGRPQGGRCCGSRRCPVDTQ